MEWIEVTSKTQFTAREARANKKLRPLFATEDAIRTLFETLVEYELLIRMDDDTYERIALCVMWFVVRGSWFVVDHKSQWLPVVQRPHQGFRANHNHEPQGFQKQPQT